MLDPLAFHLPPIHLFILSPLISPSPHYFTSYPTFPSLFHPFSRHPFISLSFTPPSPHPFIWYNFFLSPYPLILFSLHFSSLHPVNISPLTTLILSSLVPSLYLIPPFVHFHHVLIPSFSPRLLPFYVDNYLWESATGETRTFNL